MLIEKENKKSNFFRAQQERYRAHTQRDRNVLFCSVDTFSPIRLITTVCFKIDTRYLQVTLNHDIVLNVLDLDSNRSKLLLIYL